MKDIKIKLKEIFIPYLIIAIATITVFNFLRWFFDIYLGIQPLKEDLVNIFIPLIIPWLPITIWLTPRTHLLKTKKNDSSGIRFLMLASIALPIIISQNYISKAFYKLQPIQSAIDVKELQNEKYFSIERIKVNRNACYSYALSRVTGEHGDNLNFHLYLACPFIEDEKPSNIWYGIEYRESIKNNLSDESKQSAYKAFFDQSSNDFKSYNFQRAVYFEKIGFTDDQYGYLEAIKKKLPDFDKNEQIILEPQFEKYEDRLGNTLGWIFGTFAIGLLAVFCLVAYLSFDERKYQLFKAGNLPNESLTKVIILFLNPFGKNKIIASIMLVNILVFGYLALVGVSIISPTANQLMDFGAVRRQEIFEGEYWRLFTAMFLHSGFIHLGMNLFTLFICYFLLEKMLHPLLLLLVYLIGGICSSLASIYWYEHTASVGASGAIFCLFGCILIFNLLKIYPEENRGIVWLGLGIFGGISLVFGFFTSGVDNAGHLGGLACGIVLGLILIIISKDKLMEKAKSGLFN